jgi:hypothetical protein
VFFRSLNMGKRIFYFFIAIALTFINDVYAQVPIITYATPQVYTTGTAIATLSPTTSGGAIVTGSYAPTSTFANVSTPYGVALDASGNVYSLDESHGYLYKNTATINIYNIYLATGIAVDGLGNIYVSDFYTNNVLKLNSSGTVLSTTTGFNAPYGIAIDASNNAYVVDNGTNSVIKIAAGTTTKSTFLTGFTNPYGITIDPSGNTFVSQITSNSIIKVAFGSTTQTTFATGFNGPRNLTNDASGNVYVADLGNNAIKKIAPGGTVSTILSGLSSPRGVAFDASGNLYEADFGTNTIKKSVPAGYTISAVLPAGLSFNTSTGAITGTPTTVTATTVYTITAYNTSGSGATTVSITVNNASASYGNYAFNKPITLNTTTLGITSNLTGFPALLSIQDNNLIISGGCADKVQNPNGPNYDFAFIDPGSATELYYQVESYNQTTGTLLVWVQIPTLTYATNNSIYFYFGAQSPTVTHNAAFFANTWASNYLAVFHFNEAVYTGFVTDGTAGGHTGTSSGMTSADLVAGKIGTAYTFNGSSKKITTNAVSVTGTFTVSAWVKLTTTGLDQKVMTNQDASGSASGGYKLGIYNTNFPESESGLSVNRNATPNPTAFASGAWHYIQSVYTGSTLSTYVDGLQYKILTTSNNPSTNLNLYIGVGEGGTGYYFNGLIDEPRVSNVAKTADWIKAEYGDQNNPTLFTNGGVTTVNTTNAAIIPGTLTYTWTGTTSTNPTIATNWTNTTTGTTNQLPAFDGTASLVIPAGLSNYPSLTVDESLYGLTIASGASLNLNGHTLSVACKIYNNATTGGTGILTAGSTSSGIIWNGSLAAQTFTGANTINTTALGNMTLNNSSAGTLTITGGPVDIYNTITIIKGNLVIDNAGNGDLTLKSTSMLSASVAAIPSSYSITGFVNVERYISGGAAKYRGYRFLSSPIYTAKVGTDYFFDFSYLSAYAPITGTLGTSGGMSKTGNPTIFLYRENVAVANNSYNRGNFRSVNKINNSPLYTVGVDFDGNYSMHPGTGFWFFYRGNTSNIATKYTPTTIPEANVFVTRGTLNQQAVTVVNWYTGLSTLQWTVVPGNTGYSGYNLVGNPYASSIDWNNRSTTDPTAGIFAPQVGNTIYIYNESTKIYGLYDGTTGTNGASNIIPSGQGFYVKAIDATAQLIFHELAKTSAQVTGPTAATGATLLLSTKPVASAAPLQYMRLEMAKDSDNIEETIVRFESSAKNEFVDSEDSEHMSGSGGVSFSSKSSDNITLGINHIHFPGTTQTVIKLNASAATDGLYAINRTELIKVPELYEIWLMDAFKKDSLDLKHNSTYKFDVLKSDTNTYGSNRFSLVIRQNSALGMHLLDFTAIKATNGVPIAWKTENEDNYTNFTVERSTDNGVTFSVLGGFTSNSQHIYNFLDANPVNTVDLYRLKLEDLNGTISYSKAITIVYDPSKQALAGVNINIYPNPTIGVINLAINQNNGSSPGISGLQNINSSAPVQNAGSTSYTIKIVNVSGTVIRSVISSQPTWQDDVSALLPGTYIVQVVNNKDKSPVGKATFVKL